MNESYKLNGKDNVVWGHITFVYYNKKRWCCYVYSIFGAFILWYYRLTRRVLAIKILLKKIKMWVFLGKG